MTVTQVCQHLGISRATLFRRIEAGEIKPLPKNPMHKKAHRVLFDRSEVERFWNEQQTH